MASLPTGSVTFLFSGIDDATRRRHRDPAGYARLLERHLEILRELVAANAGMEIGAEGDSFVVAFHSAVGAVTTAVAAQRALNAEKWPGGTGPQVRMGLVSGEAEWRGGRYLGLDLTRATRLAAAAQGGQIVISEETRALAELSLGEGVTLHDLGVLQLNDVDLPERVYQVSIAGLVNTSTPVFLAAVGQHNLPASLTSFLGRIDDITSLMLQLEKHRVVTLTGPGGVGKTRLSLEVARRMLGHFADGVWFIELAPIREAPLVVPEIAAQLGLPDRGGDDPVKALVAHVGDRHMLLVLDNFEQVLPAARSVGQLLRGAPGLSVLASSRSPLHIYGEQQYPVAALSAPPLTGLEARAAALARFDSIALFAERAAAAAPRFALDDGNAAAVAGICAHLDGLPLAIEVAAARVKLLPPAAILNRLHERLDLRSTAHDAPERHMSLRNAIAWSYDLLPEQHRRLFAGLSVFVDGAQLDAIEYVLSDPDHGTLDGLQELVDNSLVRNVQTIGDTRFKMLETMREFALDSLRASGSTSAVQGLHASYYANLVEQARPQLVGDDAGAWLDRLELEHDNIRAAITHARDAGDATMALQICAGMWRFWQRRGYLAEGLSRVQSALATPGEINSALRADALEAGGGLAYWQGNSAITRQMYGAALALRRELGDQRAVAEALYNLSFSYTWLSLSDANATADPEESLRLLREALALYQKNSDDAGVFKTLWGDGEQRDLGEQAPECSALRRAS